MTADVAVVFCLREFSGSIFWLYSPSKWVGTVWVSFFYISHGIARGLRGRSYSRYAPA